MVQRVETRVLPHAGVLLALLVILPCGCSSNRFQLANRGQRERSEFYASVPNRRPGLRVPAAPPGFGSPLAQSRPPAAIPRSGRLPGSSLPVLGPGSGAPAAIATPGARGFDFAPAPMVATNSRANEAGPSNRPRPMRRPAPGSVGTSLQRPADGPELVGRVVNEVGQPEARVGIRAIERNESSRVTAEVASGPDGSFRIRNLRAGAQYQLVAVGTVDGRRRMGSTIAVPPDTAVIIQLDRPYGSPVSSAGERFGVDGQSSRPLLRPMPRSVATRSNPQAPALGAVTVTTPALIGRALRVPAAPASRRPAGDHVIGARRASTRPGLPRTDANASGARTASARESSPKWRPMSGAIPRQAVAAHVLDSNRRLTDPARTAPEPTLAFAGTGLERETLFTSAGEARSLGRLTGDLILLDFFGGWCGPCRRCVPKLNALHQRFGVQGLQVIGVACESGSQADAIVRAEETRRELAIDYAVLASPLDEPSAVRDRFGVHRYPTLVLLDRRGRILFRGTGGGAETFARLESAIRFSLSSSAVAGL